MSLNVLFIICVVNLELVDVYNNLDKGVWIIGVLVFMVDMKRVVELVLFGDV